MDPLLDEDGRCTRTELLPSDCGCAAHRGGEAIEDLEGEGAARKQKYLDDLTEGLLVHRFRTAKYDGRCVLDRRHVVEAGSEIGLVVREEDLAETIGWVCELCVRTILA